MTILNLIQRATGPDFGAFGGSADIRRVIGALLTYGLLFACLMLIISAAAWAIASSNGSWQSASKAKAGVFVARSEEHTSELQSLMRISYAVFCLKKKTIQKNTQ